MKETQQRRRAKAREEADNLPMVAERSETQTKDECGWENSNCRRAKETLGSKESGRGTAESCCNKEVGQKEGRIEKASEGGTEK